MSQYTFTLIGKIKPAVRMTRRGKFANPQAIDYLESQRALKWQLKKQMVENDWDMLPAKTPLAVELSIGTNRLHTCDIDNLCKAVMDSANNIVYPDDRWVDKVNVWRYPSSDYKAALSVWIR